MRKNNTERGQKLNKISKENSIYDTNEPNKDGVILSNNENASFPNNNINDDVELNKNKRITKKIEKTSKKKKFRYIF